MARAMKVVGVGHAPAPTDARTALPGRDRVTWHIADPRDVDAVQALFAQRKPQRVVHGAAWPRRPPSNDVTSPGSW
ncbi:MULTISPECIES: hypothetical protein [Roseomonadaceae]|uniref:hypothetical protein n=1 Tax=Roseomonadaceae TaxID=3385906 RepID=UPI00360BA146